MWLGTVGEDFLEKVGGLHLGPHHSKEDAELDCPGSIRTIKGMQVNLSVAKEGGAENKFL